MTWALYLWVVVRGFLNCQNLWKLGFVALRVLLLCHKNGKLWADVEVLKIHKEREAGLLVCLAIEFLTVYYKCFLYI